MKSFGRVWLFAVVLLSLAVTGWAAVSESFDGYSQNSYTPPWTYNGFYGNLCIVNNGTSSMGGNTLPSPAVRMQDGTTGAYLEYIGTDGNGKDGGVGTISFQWRAWDNTPATVDDVMVAIDGGAYQMVGAQINSTTYTPYQTWTYDLNSSSDNIKIKVLHLRGERLHVDDFSITDHAGADLTPPVIAFLTVVNNTTIDVHFNETVTVASAEIEANYSVNNGVGAPSSAVLTDTATVRLIFATIPNGSYILTADSVRDAAGNGSHSTAPFSIDTTPPSIVSVTATSRTAVSVLFDEPVEATSAGTVGNYSVDGGVGTPLTAARNGGNTSLVNLTFNSIANGTYLLTANNVTDLSGNPCSGTNGSFIVNITVEPGYVTINEVMYNDSFAGNDSEWVELHNTTAAPINIGGWVLTDAGQYPPTSEGAIQIPTGTTIPAGGYLVVCRDSLPGITGWVRCHQYYGSWGLGNSGDNLALFTDSVGGTLIDGSLTAYYPNLSTGAYVGYSIEKCNENGPWGSADSLWHLSTNAFAPNGRFINCTPGVANTPCVTDNTPPTLSSVTVISNFVIDVTFDENVDSATAVTLLNYSVNLGVGAPSSAVRQSNHAIVRLTFGSALAPNSYTLTVNNVRDIAQNPILPNSQIGFVVSPPADQLIFTEIMPNPNFAGTADSLGEWFEVYNPGVSTINLQGWLLTDGGGDDTISTALSINPGQYLVFGSNANTATNGGVPVDYQYHFATLGSGLALANSNDSLVIKNAAGLVSATLVYNTGFGFSEGHSTQLRDLSWDTAVDTNWCRADTQWVGATQGDRGTPRAATICAPILPVQYYTLCDIRDQDDCGNASLLGRRIITQGIVTFADSCRINAYIQSNGCAVMIYGNVVRDTMTNIGRRMQAGDLVEVNGYVTQFNGLTEIATFANVVPTITLISAGNTTPAPVAVTAAEVSKNLAACTPEPLESKFVRLLDMTFVHTAADTFVGGVNYLAFNGTDTVAFRVNACDAIVGDSIPNAPVPITAILGQYQTTVCRCGGYQLLIGNVNPFAAVQCATPTDLTVYRNTNNVTLRWMPGAAQTCTCYEIYWAADASAVFPTGYTLLTTVTGTTEYTDTNPLSAKRFYMVRAGGPTCP